MIIWSAFTFYEQNLEKWAVVSEFNGLSIIVFNVWLRDVIKQWRIENYANQNGLNPETIILQLLLSIIYHVYFVYSLDFTSIPSSSRRVKGERKEAGINITFFVEN